MLLILCHGVSEDELVAALLKHFRTRRNLTESILAVSRLDLVT